MPIVSDIVDAQLHEPAPFEDWSGADEGTRRRVLTEALWQSMDAVGVNAVALNALEDPAWAADLARRFPSRVGFVASFDPEGHGILDVDAHVADLRAQPGAVALRIAALQTPVTVRGRDEPMVSGANLSRESFEQVVAGKYDDVLAAC